MSENQTPTKRLAIMQPYFLPYIGYFQLVAAVDTFVIYDDVNFIKKGWIHRNNILVNGQANLFTIPLAKVSQNKLINEVALSDDWNDWATKFLKTVEQSYKKAPYFQEVYSLLQNILSTPTQLISELATASIREVANYLELKTEIIPSSAVYENTHLKAQERILDICLKEQANHYINPTGGKSLYDKQLFSENGILLNFIQSEKINYPQFKNEFVPWLSMLDILMFNSKGAISQLLENYTLL